MTHQTLLVRHARAVIEWLARPEGPATELHKLEDRVRGLAGIISSKIERGMEFVLILCNHGTGPDDPNARLTHISSMDRATVISLVGEYVDSLGRKRRAVS